MVLVTRPLASAQATAALLAERGYRPVIAPLLTIAPKPAELPPPETLQAVLVGSGHAVHHLPASHRGLRLLAVGDATASLARAKGHREVLSAAADAARLAALAAERLDPAGKPLLLAVGEGQGERLAAALAARGFSVTRRAVYTTTAARSLPPAARALLQPPRDDARVARARDAEMRAGELRVEGEMVSAALFFSAETARVFGALVAAEGLAQRLSSITALAISASAAAVLRPLPWREVRAAPHPDQEALLALLS
jgi:uroporphyrinogen-III synthase